MDETQGPSGTAAAAASGSATATVARPAGRGGRRPGGCSDDASARRHPYHGMTMHNLFSIIWFFFCRENALDQSKPAGGPAQFQDFSSSRRPGLQVGRAAAAAADAGTGVAAGAQLETALGASASNSSSSCSLASADLAARKSRETGRLVSPADVAIVKWSVASDSLASSRWAGGTATLDADRELLDLARDHNQVCYE